MVFASYCFLPVAEHSSTARRNCYCLARRHLQRALERVSVPVRMEEGKEANRLLFGSLVDVGLCGQNGQHEAAVSRKSLENK